MGRPTLKQLAEFLTQQVPIVKNKIILEALEPGSTIVRHKIGPDELRPGGTVSGPVLMLLADVALYVAILGEIGIVPLAVTTNLTINFLRKPSADYDILAECKLLKVGKTLATGEVYFYSVGDEQPVAHATGTYAIPTNNLPKS